ncbi:MAG: alkaline phosphatase family protein [Terriglobia bacterium]|jgi:DNA-binding beta-propeller fold protein YncE
MPRRVLFALFLAYMLLAAVQSSLGEDAQTPKPAVLQAPAGRLPVKINPRGVTILPNGRLITPFGKYVKVAPHPYGLALSPDGKTLVTVNGGTSPFSASILTDLWGLTPHVAQIPPGFKSSDADPQSVFLGAAIARDNRTLFLSEGNNGNVGIFDLVSLQRLGALSLDGKFQGKEYNNSLSGELLLSRDSKVLYVLDLAHFRLVVFDTRSKQIISSLPVGRMPFGLALSRDGKRVYVSNVGTFRYSLVPNYDAKNPRETGITFPAFGYPSKDAEAGTTVEGKAIAGLGDPNVQESNSLYVIDVRNPRAFQVLERIRTGLPIGDKVVGGSSPGAVVAGKKKIFVSNATQDSITVIDVRSGKAEQNALITPATEVKGLRGVLPFGMALSANERRLYVACAGINAVAVVETDQMQLLGFIPAGWFPARVALSNDGKTLFVANAKGFGAGPNGGKGVQLGPEGAYIGDITKGTVSILTVPKDYQLRPFTLQVMKNNGFVPGFLAEATKPAPERPPGFPIPFPGSPSSKIHHVIYITKENRTYDEVLGDLAGADGDATLARWGMDATVKETKVQVPILEHIQVTPNQHAIARRFAFGDNFYVDSDVSVDGHHWLVGNYPNELLESAWPAGYGGKFDFIPDPDAPGRLDIGASSTIPETYLENGSLWENLARARVTFRNYGEGMELPGDDESTGEYPTGSRQVVNAPMPKVLFDNTSREFPTFNTNISDQYRFAQFKKEFDEFVSGAKPMPQFIYIWLPNDHTSDPRPEDGFAYHASYVADNDLALGKLVELFSHSPYWNDMAIFVTEDDAQDGQDHVDAHRSLVLAISPYAKPGVSHVHTSMASIIKTINLILGMPFVNQYDAAASDLSDMFTNTPDFTPYDALPSDTRIFDPAKVKEPGLEAKPGAPLDNPDLIRKEMENRTAPKP